ncbi:ABC transporter ATP-binding protein [Paenibacillus sp. p3-SID867]|uniref:ATP-binding cassette domain-containing protein n=1 Tax=Paenibacillus sp. p3-SID867 TaxID=2916363 RepID=UPI0021A4FA23|nr:ABC transporter ATP-binding protein [Paenibacillus sp. p3-SID867]MCT1403811.1 ABC transporter ATP-binding protein [Paenibacillus sp. p3-SID867]
MKILMKSAFTKTSVQSIGPISMTLYPGLNGLVGPNGSGKSAFIQLLAHCIPLHSGSIKYELDSIVLSVSQTRQQRGYVPQDISIYDRFTVQKYLSYIAGLKLRGVKDVRNTIDFLDDFLEIRPLLNQKLGEISVGQQRIAMIAQSLIGDPRFLFYDEPFNNLDIRQRKNLLELLSVLANQSIILLSNHLVEEMRGCYDQIISMKDGTITNISSQV